MFEVGTDGGQCLLKVGEDLLSLVPVIALADEIAGGVEGHLPEMYTLVPLVATTWLWPVGFGRPAGLRNLTWALIAVLALRRICTAIVAYLVAS